MNPERVPAPEIPEAGFEAFVTPETAAEPRPEKPRETSIAEGAPVAAAFQAVAAIPQVAKDPVFKKVEEILEADLGEAYLSMPPDLQLRFKKRGEEVATAIQRMVLSAKVKAKDVLKLLISWLRMIPHVNRFFLEQEAKIKADRIVALAERQSK